MRVARSISAFYPSLATAILVFLSRLPFISLNYGYDGDAWNVARAAGRIAASGRYEFSRPPGYPVQEIFCSFFQSLGPLVSNGLTALFCALAAGALVRILQSLRVQPFDAVLAALALAFVPVIYINSVVTLDYVWALAWILVSLNAAIRSRPVQSGLALGVAIGCRITSGLMLLPFALMLFVPCPPGKRIRRLALFAMPAILLGLLWYLPAWRTYGAGFLRFVDEPIDLALRLKLVTYGIIIGTWGLPGTAGLLLAVLVVVGGRFFGRGPSASPGDEDRFAHSPRILLASSLLAIALVLFVFVRLPVESAYLIPVVPFVILLLVSSVPPRVARVTLFAIFLSPFIGHLDLSMRFSPAGPLVLDRITKAEQLDSIRDVYGYVNELACDEIVLVTGGEIDRFRAMPDGQNAFSFDRPVLLLPRISGPDRNAHLEQGRPVLLLVKEGHLYTTGFLYSPPAPGRQALEVHTFSPK